MSELRGRDGRADGVADMQSLEVRSPARRQVRCQHGFGMEREVGLVDLAREERLPPLEGFELGFDLAGRYSRWRFEALEDRISMSSPYNLEGGRGYD